jgi:protein SCO1/2
MESWSTTPHRPHRLASRLAAPGWSLVLLVAVTACSRSAEREYQLTGQVLAVDPSRQEITIKHEDIPQFMPGMTMAFKVKDGRLLDGRAPGDLVRATLVVGESEAHLRTLEGIGHAPVAGTAPTAGANLLREGEIVADSTFIDESGATRHLTDWRGRAIAITFIYTRCPVPTFCPLMDRHFKAAQDLVRADPALEGNAQLLSISFDPDYDTPAVLSQHALRVQADPAVWRFLTGTRADVEKFASQFGISVMREGVDNAEIVHNLRTAVIDPQGRLVTVLRGGEWTPAELVSALRSARER